MEGNPIPSSPVELRLEAGGLLHLLQMTSADKSAPPDDTAVVLTFCLLT